MTNKPEATIGELAAKWFRNNSGTMDAETYKIYAEYSLTDEDNEILCEAETPLTMEEIEEIANAEEELDDEHHFFKKDWVAMTGLERKERIGSL